MKQTTLRARHFNSFFVVVLTGKDEFGVSEYFLEALKQLPIAEGRAISLYNIPAIDFCRAFEP